MPNPQGQPEPNPDNALEASPPSPPAAAPPPPSVIAAQDRFIETWGRMGSSWGISRTMGEVHALLYITGEPLCTDDVMQRLDISRGNASMTLRALTDWGIAHRTHKRGDRKEYYLAEQEVWSMFRTIARERKKRELDPLLVSLFEIRDATKRSEKSSDNPAVVAHHNRLDQMLGAIEAMDALMTAALGQEEVGVEGMLERLTAE